MENGHRDARELVARVLAEKEFDSVKPETIVSLVHDPARWIARAILHMTTRSAPKLASMDMP